MLWHCIAAQSVANGARLKCPYQGPRYKPVSCWSSRERSHHCCEILQPLNAEAINGAGEIRGPYPGLPNLADMFFTFRKSDDIA